MFEARMSFPLSQFNILIINFKYLSALLVKKNILKSTHLAFQFYIWSKSFYLSVSRQYFNISTK